jgi:hypothetical protein
MTYTKRFILSIQLIACPAIPYHAMPWLTLTMYCLVFPCQRLPCTALIRFVFALPYQHDRSYSLWPYHPLGFLYILRSYSTVRVSPSAFSISSFSAVQYSTVPCRVISCCVMRCHVVLCIRSDLDIPFCDHLTVSRSEIQCRDFFLTLDNPIKDYFLLFIYLFIISCSFSPSLHHSHPLPLYHYHSHSFSRAHTRILFSHYYSSPNSIELIEIKLIWKPLIFLFSYDPACSMYHVSPQERNRVQFLGS